MRWSWRLSWLCLALSLLACAREPVALLEVDGVANERIETGMRVQIAGHAMPTGRRGRVRFVGETERENGRVRVDVARPAEVVSVDRVELVADAAWIAAVRGKFAGRVEVELPSRVTREAVRGEAQGVSFIAARDELDEVDKIVFDASVSRRARWGAFALVAAVAWLSLLAWLTPVGLWLGVVVARLERIKRLAVAASANDAATNVARLCTLASAIVIAQKVRPDSFASSVGIVMVATLGEAVYGSIRAGAKLLPRALLVVAALASLELLSGGTRVSFTDFERSALGGLPALLLSPAHLLATWVAFECAAGVRESNAWVRALRTGACAALLAPMLAPYAFGAAFAQIVGALLSSIALEAMSRAPLRGRVLAPLALAALAAAAMWTRLDVPASSALSLATTVLFAWLIASLVLRSALRARAEARALDRDSATLLA